MQRALKVSRATWYRHRHKFRSTRCPLTNRPLYYAGDLALALALNTHDAQEA